MDAVRPIILSIAQSRMFQLLVVLIVADVLFGCLRSIKERKFCSSVGISGLIRKTGMLLSVVVCAWCDSIINLNLIGFVPEAVREYLPLSTVGIMEFFAVIYCVYEVLSVLKNMTLSGLPVDKIWEAVRKFLKNNTGEIIDVGDDDDEEDEAEQEEEVETSEEEGGSE